MKAKAHNLKCLFRQNFKAFELLLTYIHPFLASLSVLFKHKSLNFADLSLFLLHILIFWLEHLYILPKLQRPGCTYFGTKPAFYSWNLSEKVSLMYENSNPIPLLCKLKYITLYFIHNNMESSRKWLIPYRDCADSWNWPSDFWAVQYISRQQRDFYADGPCIETIFLFLVTMVSIIKCCSYCTYIFIFSNPMWLLSFLILLNNNFFHPQWVTMKRRWPDAIFLGVADNV